MNNEQPHSTPAHSNPNDNNGSLFSEIDAAQQKLGHETSTKFDMGSVELRETSPKELGPFRLLRCLGEGGMGSVWLAQQEKPVARKVALKLIKSRLSSAEVLSRFETERKALAMMDHPNIARILDVGETKEGQPYFAMEWVNGIPITEYCDQKRLSVDQRLRLFAAVCSGVQHAHQKGIIHRDIKPTNILVADVEGEPIPKVIDFGLAKAIQETSDLTEQSMVTGIGQIMGTLKYMSPEQAGLRSVDIDTRTDVYSLGVLLYELLTSCTPLENSIIRKETILVVLDLIRRSETPKPSSQLSHSDLQIAKQITDCRQTDIHRLQRILTGDLDWVVMKALEKDRDRRYESAASFGEDIRRYLNSEPVIARPPSLGYQCKKFVRKNRSVVLAASLLLLALVAGITGTTIAMFRAMGAEKLAENRLMQKTIARKEAFSAQMRQSELLEKDRVSLEAIARSENEKMHANKLAADILDSIFLSKVSGNEQLAANLSQVADRIGKTNFGSIPDNVMLQFRISRVLEQLGRTEQAETILQKAYETSVSELGKENTSTIWLARQVALKETQTVDAKAGIEKLETLLEKQRRRKPPIPEDLLDSLIEIAPAYQQLGKMPEELAVRREISELSRQVPGFDKKASLRYDALLGHCLWRNKLYSEAVDVYSAVVNELQTNQSPDKQLLLTSQASLGINLFESGQHAKSIPIMEQVVRASDSSNFDYVREKLLQAYVITKNKIKFEESAALELERFRKSLPRQSRDYSLKLGKFVHLYMLHGDWETAEKLARENLTLLLELDSDSYEVFQMKTSIGLACLRLDRLEEAEQYLLDSYDEMQYQEFELKLENWRNRMIELLGFLIELDTRLEQANRVQIWTAEQKKLETQLTSQPNKN